MSTAAVAEPARPLERLGRWLDAHAWLTIAWLVSLAWLLRTLAGWARATPTYLPDEVTYSLLARSVAESGIPTYLGSGLPFPNVLSAYLTAPAWIPSDLEGGLRLSTLIGALAISATAIPVFALARKVGLSPRSALLVAAYVLVLPGLTIGSWLVAEPFALPLAMAATWAAVSAIDEPRAARQATLLGLSLLAAAAKPHAVVVPAAYVLAVVACGLRERRLRAALAEQRVALAGIAAAVALAVALGVGRLGVYAGVADLAVEPASLAHWIGRNALALAHGGLWAPVALGTAGCLVLLARATRRVEFALAVIALGVTAMLLCAAAFVSSSVDRHVHERYLLAGAPLLAVAALAARSRASTRITIPILAAFAVASMLVPVSGLVAGGGASDSPALRAVALGEEEIGVAGAAAAVLASALAMLALAAGWRKRGGAAAVAIATLLAGVAGSLSASAFDARNAERALQRHAPLRGWIDEARAGSATLLLAGDPDPAVPLLALFWNRSLTGALYLDGVRGLPWLPGARIESLRDGRIVLATPGTAIAVDESSTTVELADAELLARSPLGTLWRPSAAGPRLALLAAGRRGDGWTAPRLTVRIWPERAGTLAGWLELAVSAPGAEEGVEIESGAARATVAPGSTRAFRVAVCGTGPTDVTVTFDPARSIDGRLVAARTQRPAFIPDASACAPVSPALTGSAGLVQRPSAVGTDAPASWANSSSSETESSQPG